MLVNFAIFQVFRAQQMIADDVVQNIKITEELGEYRSTDVDRIRMERNFSNPSEILLYTQNVVRPDLFFFVMAYRTTRVMSMIKRAS